MVDWVATMVRVEGLDVLKWRNKVGIGLVRESKDLQEKTRRGS